MYTEVKLVQNMQKIIFLEFHIQYLKYLGNGCPLCPGGSARTAGGARQVAPAGRLCAPRSRSPLQFIQPPPPVHPSIFKTSHSRLLSRLKTLLVGKLLQSPTYHAPSPPSHNILPTVWSERCFPVHTTFSTFKSHLLQFHIYHNLSINLQMLPQR